MSFKIKKEISVNLTDPNTGVVLGTTKSFVDVDVTVDKVELQSDNTAIAYYSMSTSGNNIDTSYTVFTFMGGNLFTEAETAVQDQFFGS